MGMFDKDKVFAPDGRMDKWVDDGQEYIVWGCRIVTEEFDAAKDDSGKKNTMVHWYVSDLQAPENLHIVSTIGDAMARKAKDNDGSGLPAVVKNDHVESDKGNDAYVMNWIRSYEPSKEVLKGIQDKLTQHEAALA